MGQEVEGGGRIPEPGEPPAVRQREGTYVYIGEGNGSHIINLQIFVITKII